MTLLDGEKQACDFLNGDKITFKEIVKDILLFLQSVDKHRLCPLTMPLAVVKGETSGMSLSNQVKMMPTLSRDIPVPSSVLKRRFAICTIHVVSLGRRQLERRGGISVDRSENALLIRMLDSDVPPLARTKDLSNSDWLLLDTLDTHYKRPHYTGRFLTMHKRRRKRLITRSLAQDHALLDDIHHGQVQCVLQQVSQWPFNAFILDNVTGGRSLPVLCVHLFHWYGLLDYFKLDVVSCWKFFSLIEEGYHSTNPYHNSIHATDVTQAMHCFLQEKKIRKHLTPFEIMASLIAAVTHDLDHPGVNQPFLIATSNHLAALYENSSVLENHHWRSAIGCLLESHVAENLEDCRPELQKQISSLILATDITRQQEFLIRFKNFLDQDILNMELHEHRHFILQIALKCADISNPCRPWEISKKWSQKVCEEFFRQGDYERQLNLPVTALCDRQITSVPKIQEGFKEHYDRILDDEPEEYGFDNFYCFVLGFINYVVYPLFAEWHRFLGDGLSDDMMKNLQGNKLKWDALIIEEDSKKMKAEIINDVSKDTEGKLSPSNSSKSDILSLDSCTINFLSSSNLISKEKSRRRHSLPVYTLAPPSVSRSKLRRESLAMGEKKSVTYFRTDLLKEEEEGEDQAYSESLENPNISILSWETNSDASNDIEEEERPLSSENLLPELSITSITTTMEANRLSNVLGSGKDQQKTKNKVLLKRQQTFPPVLPYVRQRYFSTTADMTPCSDIRTDQSYFSSKSSQEETEESSFSTHCGTIHGCKTPPPLPAVILKQNNKPRWNYCGNDRQINGKRESEVTSQEKVVKVAKFFDAARPEYNGKENVDPKGFISDLNFDVAVFNKSENTRKNSSQGLISRRRGSAPDGSDFFSPLALAFRGCGDRFLRRGSAPINALSYNMESENREIPQDVSLTSSQHHCLYQRRSSVPSETGCSDGLRPKNRNPKVLRRRSSGGPEMFCVNQKGSDNIRLKMDVIVKKPSSDSKPDSFLTRRRGSLPIEFFVANVNAGDHREIHDS